MWVVDNEKARERTMISNEVNGLITRVTRYSNECQELKSEIGFVTGGSLVGTDSMLLADCDQSIASLSRSLESLYRCLQYVHSLDVMKWVPDDE